jgi:hypothetical protein
MSEESPALTSTVEAVEELRERFATMGAVFAGVCVLLILWVRSPALAMELPLGDAKASLNVGYVLSIGMPVIAIVYAWISGSLVLMRRRQLEVLSLMAPLPKPQRDLITGRLLGSSALSEHGYLDRLAGWMAAAARMVVLFVVPSAACLLIAIRYFTGLEIYPAYDLAPCWSLSAASPARISGECRRDVALAEHLVGLTMSKTLFGTPGAHKNDRYAIVNGDIEESCTELWHRKAVGAAPTKDTPDACVFDKFPRMVLPLNSWVNFLGLVATIWLAVFGWRAHVTLPSQPSSTRDGQPGGKR